MEYYVTIKESNNEEIIKEIKKWYNTNIIECPLCQKMILIKEAIDYNEEFKGRICKSCFEKEENNNKIELRIEKIMKICERAEVKKNKNELEKVIKGILDKYLKKEMNTEENKNEEMTNEITETEERLRRIKGLIKYLEIEATEGELLIDEVQGTVTEIEIHKLLEWGYNSRAILSNRIIFQYRKLKMELDPYEEDDKEVKEKLRDYILEAEEDDYDTDNSEKIGEILNPEEHEE
ncbi:hypothetical protein C1646_759623 [Rhizophagus diaphanus]|nr:hypothetical protein C1646_759623 [Rhizophagus diaphanus] [Rhizophagus sp. MUCL 43196]